MASPEIKLHKQREKRVLGGHPWIYSNEIVIDQNVRNIDSGAMVVFRSHDGGFLGKGSYNAHSLIAGRIYTRNATEEINAEWIAARLRSALSLREKMVGVPYYRLIHAEADGLPGLIVDRFGDYVSAQLNSAGSEKLWPEIKSALLDVLKPNAIFLHNDGYQRVLEGLTRSSSIAYDKDGIIGEKLVTEVQENGMTYYADLIGGQKTGWYYDQRDNHAMVAEYCDGAKVLDLYCYSGGFGLLAAKHGATHVTGVDSSQPALDLADMAAKKSTVSAKCEWVRADVFEELEKRASNGDKYGVVIADPPPFVKSKKDLASGSRGYRKLAKMCAKVVAENGFLFIASCSHNMDLQSFLSEIARGLNEARREGRVLKTVFAAPDHPLHPSLPESGYLKGLLIQLY